MLEGTHLLLLVFGFGDSSFFFYIEVNAYFILYQGLTNFFAFMRVLSYIRLCRYCHIDNLAASDIYFFYYLRCQCYVLGVAVVVFCLLFSSDFPETLICIF